MPTAFVHLPPQAHYRREAFINGFSRLGFIVRQGQPTAPLGADDVAVVWNRTARSQQTVDMAKQGEGALIVAENGYYGKDANGHQPYAMALDGHCGSGRWYAPDDSRLQALGIEFKPFRPQEGQKVLIADQRGIGSPLMRSPVDFGLNVARELRRMGYDPVVRPHPGKDKNAVNPPLMEQLQGCRCLVVWSSNCATEALINGVPTYYCAPTIVTEPGARRYSPYLDLNTYDHLRYAAFSRMAWAQWFLAEIDSGEALKTLLDVHHRRLPTCKNGYGL